MSARQPKARKVRNLKLDATAAKSVKGGIALLVPAVQKIREAASTKK